MLWTTVVVLLMLWLFGTRSPHQRLIHLLLVINTLNAGRSRRERTTAPAFSEFTKSSASSESVEQRSPMTVWRRSVCAKRELKFEPTL